MDTRSQKRLCSHQPDAITNQLIALAQAQVQAQLQGRDQLLPKSPELDIKRNDGDSTELDIKRNDGDFFGPDPEPEEPDFIEEDAVKVAAVEAEIKHPKKRLKKKEEEEKDGSAVSVITPFVWRGHPVGSVALSENGAAATQTDESLRSRISSNVCMREIISEKTEMVLWSLTTGNVELKKGKHYWEVVLACTGYPSRAVHIGVSRPGLNPRGGDGDIHKPYAGNEVSWLVCSHTGSLYDNGERGVDAESRLIYDEGGAAVGGSADVVTGGGYVQGDRVGMLLDLNVGSLCFFRNGEEHGEGYPAGTVTGPVVAAVRMSSCGSSVRLLPRKDSNEEGSWVEVRSVVGDWNQEQ